MTVTKEERAAWRRLLEEGIRAVGCPRCNAMPGSSCTPIAGEDDDDLSHTPAGVEFRHFHRVRAYDCALAGWRDLLERCFDALDEYDATCAASIPGMTLDTDGMARLEMLVHEIRAEAAEWQSVDEATEHTKCRAVARQVLQTVLLGFMPKEES